MKKSTRKSVNMVTAAERIPKPLMKRPAHIPDSDTARRAYDLYLARGCEHGHDTDDWMQAERGLRASAATV